MRSTTGAPIANTGAIASRVRPHQATSEGFAHWSDFGAKHHGSANRKHRRPGIMLQAKVLRIGATLVRSTTRAPIANTGAHRFPEYTPIKLQAKVLRIGATLVRSTTGAPIANTGAPNRPRRTTAAALPEPAAAPAHRGSPVQVPPRRARALPGSAAKYHAEAR